MAWLKALRWSSCLSVPRHCWTTWFVRARSASLVAPLSYHRGGCTEKSLRFRALLPAAFGAMMVSTVARPLPTAGVRKLIRRSTSSSTHASSDNDAVGAAPSHHEFPRLDKGLFPAPEPLHVAASKASASPASWSAMVSRYHNSGRLTSSLLARRGTVRRSDRLTSSRTDN